MHLKNVLDKSEYQNIKIFLQKVTLQIVLKKLLQLQKLKILYCGRIKFVVLWIYVIVDLIGEKIVGTFYEKKCKGV